MFYHVVFDSPFVDGIFAFFNLFRLSFAIFLGQFKILLIEYGFHVVVEKFHLTFVQIGTFANVHRIFSILELNHRSVTVLHCQIIINNQSWKKLIFVYIFCCFEYFSKFKLCLHFLLLRIFFKIKFKVCLLFLLFRIFFIIKLKNVLLITF